MGFNENTNNSSNSEDIIDLLYSYVEHNFDHFYSIFGNYIKSNKIKSNSDNNRTFCTKQITLFLYLLLTNNK
jgi:hypothetical protein